MSHLALVIGGSLLAGFAVGRVFFDGLHWTVVRLQGSPHPVRLLAASAALRFGLVAAVTVALARWDPVAAPIALMGFVLARSVAVSRAKHEPARLRARSSPRGR
jgi:F1F0 ATPase subunit 2